MTFPDMVIHLAIMAAIMYPNSITAAGEYFVNQCFELGYRIPRNVPNFINYWRNRTTAEGNVIHNNHNAGRPKVLTAAQVERAYNGIIGWRAAGRSRPYGTATQVLEMCPVVQAVLAESGAAWSTRLKAMRDKHPHFGYKELTPKWALTDSNKVQRVSTCTDLKGRPVGDKLKAVFIDAKSIHMHEQAIYGYVDTSVERSVTGIQAARLKGKVIVLRYYAAVSAELGPIKIKFYTGTTGMDCNHDGHHYKVRDVRISFGGWLSLT